MSQTGFLTKLRRFARRRDGVSAVEFALILPVFALLYFASIEVSLLMLVDRKVTHTASALGDLVARGTTLTKSEVSDIFAASSAIFQPYDGSAAQMRVTSIKKEKGKRRSRMRSKAKRKEYREPSHWRISGLVAGETVFK